ncbi:hypothetical protein M0R45_006796 [Rubus argutus]|uniref:Uncharacterized protein n=1 Tax=Rubus argutus TaxID=59490 RepID=A0AAW1YS79_RUBAR
MAGKQLNHSLQLHQFPSPTASTLPCLQSPLCHQATQSAPNLQNRSSLCHFNQANPYPYQLHHREVQSSKQLARPNPFCDHRCNQFPQPIQLSPCSIKAPNLLITCNHHHRAQI